MDIMGEAGAAGLLRCARNDEENRHCEERSDETIQRRHRAEGFTLVELMVVIVIIGLLATIVILNVMPAADRAAATKAKADIATIDQAVQMYRLDNQRYPTNEEGITLLVSERYLRRGEDDPWGNPYRYSAPGRSGEPYTIMTFGADGREGGSGENADIAN
jgi:general secretion pathway protein G